MKFLTNIDLSKNQLLNAALQKLGTAPASPISGQVYYNTGDNKAYVYNGTSWVDLTQQDTTTRIKGGASGTLVSGDINLLAGTGISLSQSGNDITITGSSANLTFTGDVTGTGSTGSSIALTLADISGLVAGTYKSVTVDSKGRITSGTNPTTLSGYGITDAQPLDADLTAIAALSGTAGFLKTNGSGGWSVSNPTTLSGFGITDAYTKTEVDSLITGLEFKSSVKAISTSNITLSGAQTIDGVSVVAGDRVLVAGQTISSQNGIYLVAAGAWTRATDFDNTPGTEVSTGCYVYVDQGTTYANSGWVLSTTGTITIGTTGLTFVQFNGLAQVTAGTGLSKNGNTISVSTVPVANGGTGATDAATARANLGVVSLSGDTMTGRLNLPSNGLVVGTNQIVTNNGNVLLRSANEPTGERIYMYLDSGNMRIAGDTAARINLEDIAIPDTSRPIQFIASDNGSLIFGNANRSGTATSASAERMRIDGSGNVGIGTTSPAARLEVAGNIIARDVATANTNSQFRLFAGAYSGNPTTLITSSALSSSNGMTIGGGSALGEDATSIAFITASAVGTLNSGTEKMRINASGSVGINTTSPAAKLDVNGTVRLGANNNTDSDTKVMIDGGGFTIGGAATQAYKAQLELNSSQLIIYSNGYYSGTDQLYDSTRAPSEIRMNSSSNNSFITFGTKDSNTAGSLERVRIDKSGNVGIGTTSPSALLDVAGTGNFAGTLTAPTASAGTNSTQVATTAFVATAVANRRYTTAVGDGTSTSFTVTHNLGQFVNIQVYETATPYNQVYADVAAASATTCTVSFATAPTSGQYTVVVVG